MSQQGYSQNVQPTQQGLNKYTDLPPGQSTTSNVLNQVENAMPGHIRTEMNAASIENQPGLGGYGEQQGLGQQGYGVSGQQQGLGQQGLQPGQPGYNQGIQQQGLGQQGLQPGQPGYNSAANSSSNTQPSSSTQPPGQGFMQAVSQSVAHAFGSTPMPGQSGYVTGAPTTSQQQTFRPGQPGSLTGETSALSGRQTSSSNMQGVQQPGLGQQGYNQGVQQQGLGQLGLGQQGYNQGIQQPGLGQQGQSSLQGGMIGQQGQPSSGASAINWGRPTVYPTPGFNANIDAERLRNAIKGVGTNDAVVIDVFGTRTSWELKQIDAAYKTMFGSMMMKDLENDLKLSGSYLKIVNYRFFTLAEFDAHNVHKSVVGPRTDDNALIETFTTRSNQQIREATEAYRRMFSREMEKDVVGDTSGNFRNLMTSLLQANRDESGRTDMNAAVADANLIYNAGEGRWGTDDLTLNNIFVTRSFQQLNLIFQEYSRISKYDIEQSIDKEMSGNLKLAMLSIIRASRDRPAFFAERLYNAMKGLGTDERTVNRVIVSRCELDLEDVKQAYNAKYGKDLVKVIEGETKGDYQRILLQILGNFRPNVVY